MDLQNLVGKLRAAVQENNAEFVEIFFEDFLNALSRVFEGMQAESVLSLLLEVEQIVGQRLSENVYQKKIFPFLLVSIKNFTPIAFIEKRAQFDLTYLQGLKNIFGKYFCNGEWVEVCMECFIETAKDPKCLVEALKENLVDWCVLKTYFMIPNLDSKGFENELKVVEQQIFFDFMSRLFDCEISVSFFDAVMKDWGWNRIAPDQINVINKYISCERISFGKGASILLQIIKNSGIVDIDWKFLMEELFRKAQNQKILLFFDVWSLISLNHRLKNPCSKEVLLFLFDKRFSFKLADSPPSDSCFLTDAQIQGVVLQMDMLCEWLDHPTCSLLQQNHISGMLLSVGAIYARSLKERYLIKCLQKISPKLPPGPDLDPVKLMMVLEILTLSQTAETVAALRQLKLFNPDRIAYLLKDWQRIYSEFEISFRNPYFLVFALSRIFEIPESEFILNLSLHSMLNISTTTEFFEHNTDKFEPNERELLKIQQRIQDPISENDPFEKRIEWACFLLCVYKFPADFIDFLLDTVISQIKPFDAFAIFLSAWKMINLCNKSEPSEKVRNFFYTPFSLKETLNFQTLTSQQETMQVFQSMCYLMESLSLKCRLKQADKDAFYANWIYATKCVYVNFKVKALEVVKIHPFQNEFIAIKLVIHEMIVEAMNRMSRVNRQTLHRINVLNIQLLDKMLEGESKIVKTKSGYKVVKYQLKE